MASKYETCRHVKEISAVKVDVTAGCKNPANVAGFVFKPICDKCDKWEVKENE